MVNNRVKRAESGSARATKQDFRTHELMPSGPVAESESRVFKAFTTFSGEKDLDVDLKNNRWLNSVT